MRLLWYKPCLFIYIKKLFKKQLNCAFEFCLHKRGHDAKIVGIKMKNKIFFIIRITIALLILTYLFSKVNTGILLDAVTGINYKYLIFVSLLMFVASVLNSLKWFIILKLRQIKITFAEALKLSRVLEKFNDLPDLFLGLVDASYVAERDVGVFLA